MTSSAEEAPDEKTTQGEPSWVSLSDPELLKLRICDLGARIQGSELQDRVAQLYAELESRGLRHFKPKLYLGDEWFSPEGVPALAIPFYLSHPRLKSLEKAMMLEVEGGTPEWCMKLMRHEAGHCFDHAYRFSKRKKWRSIFGSPEEEYNPEGYRPRPFSRSFVRNIDNWYAQAHPDEDFAETFAVWLDPSSDWKARYARWPLALQKLEYIDQLAAEVGEREMVVKTGPMRSNAAKLRSTLEAYYARRRKENAQDYPDFYDGDLRKIFNGDPSLPKREAGAASFMRRNRRVIIESVTRWTRERKFTISNLVRKLIDRCDQLDLKLGRSESETSLELSAYLATLVSNYLFTGKFKRSF